MCVDVSKRACVRVNAPAETFFVQLESFDVSSFVISAKIWQARGGWATSDYSPENARVIVFPTKQNVNPYYTMNICEIN